MNKNFFYFVASLGLALSAHSASAQTSVATVPVGMMEFSLPAGKTSYLSLPLTNQATYTGSVANVSSNTISVDDSPAPFTTSLATVGAPYFVKFLTGNEAGRVLLVNANTVSSVTLDTTDHTTGAAVALTTTGFNVQAGDSFEIFPGDTIASIFGAGTSANPLVLTGSTVSTTSDIVALYTSDVTAVTDYYFNTKVGYWARVGTTVNANNTVIYPYSAFTVLRRASYGNATLILQGRVTPVNAAVKTISREAVYTSTHYATDIALSQLHFGSNWQMGKTAPTADTLGVWNASTGAFDVYFQLPDSTWRKYGDKTNTDQSNFSIPAGTMTRIQKRAAVAGAQAFLVSAMPYSVQ